MTHDELKRTVRVWLAERDKTQLWLAAEMGVNDTQLSYVLGGHRKPSPEFVDALARVTGIVIDDASEVTR